MALAQKSAFSGEREFELNDHDFGFIASFVKDQAGIVLAEHKRHMVYSRLVRRLRQLGLKSFGEYCEYIRSGKDADEIIHLINAITTNLTSFFREKHHFDYLEEVLKSHVELFQGKKIRIWSAGCSAGMEVYSAAMVLAEVVPDLASWDVKLLATDIDTNILDRASYGVYELEQLKGITPQLMKKYFAPQNDGTYRIDKKIRDMVHFKKLNLMNERWPLRGPFQVVFCRNVMIYFDKPTQKVLVEKFARLVPQGGYLMVGHSENLFNVTEDFKLIGRTIYEKL